ncbi:uncharacterized protein [Halyomorpha halys]|uniref:uncharacterized protein n=1 Tax=Halyomorpha halys TaxID=286706 RepID=UPI0006D4DFB0|nr:uncharacterized protein LOC106677927 [Halyomorpha halys]
MPLLLVPLLISQVAGFAIEAKLDLPDPTSFVGSNGQPILLDSSLSPKIVKAFYEINFVPTSKPDRNKQFVSVSNSKGCPYSTDFCKFYFVPTKVSTVQKVDDMIEQAKKDSDIPVIEGLAVPDEEKLLRELNATIMAKVNKVVSLKRNESGDVPVYRGTVNVEQVLKSPEISSLPEYKPHWPEIKKNPCFQGPCYWRNPHQRSPSINIHSQ